MHAIIYTICSELMLLRNHRSDVVEEELAMLHRESLSQTEKRSLWSVLRDPTLLLPVVLVCALQGGQQLSGINAVSAHAYLSVIHIQRNIFVPPGFLLLGVDFRKSWPLL